MTGSVVVIIRTWVDKVFKLIKYLILEQRNSTYMMLGRSHGTDCYIGHVRITVSLFFKASLGVHPFI